MAVQDRDDHIVVEEDDARAGQTGTGLRYMLIGGVILVILGFAAAALGVFSW